MSSFIISLPLIRTNKDHNKRVLSLYLWAYLVVGSKSVCVYSLSGKGKNYHGCTWKKITGTRLFLCFNEVQRSQLPDDMVCRKLESWWVNMMLCFIHGEKWDYHSDLIPKVIQPQLDCSLKGRCTYEGECVYWETKIGGLNLATQEHFCLPGWLLYYSKDWQAGHNETAEFPLSNKEMWWVKSSLEVLKVWRNIFFFLLKTFLSFSILNGWIKVQFLLLFEHLNINAITPDQTLSQSGRK